MLLVVGCHRGEPPGADRLPPPEESTGVGAVPPRESARTSADAAVPQPPRLAKDITSDAGAGLTPTTGPSAAISSNPLYDSAGNPLPQTDQLPSSESAALSERVDALCKAILTDTPSMAHDAFFPLVAYRMVKSIADPDRDYRRRLLSNFERDIRRYHRRLGEQVTSLRCSGIRIPEQSVRWMKPGSEYNRVGYFRVLRSMLQFLDETGKSHQLPVTSLISWRGQWYVVHLDGFE